METPVEGRLADAEVLLQDPPVCSTDALTQTIDAPMQLTYVPPPKVGTRYEELAPQLQDEYDWLLRFVTRPGNPKLCLARGL